MLRTLQVSWFSRENLHFFSVHLLFYDDFLHILAPSTLNFIMSSHRHRKRSRSREKSPNTSTHKSSKRPKNVSAKTAKHNEDVLQQILQSVTELKADLSACNSRISALESPSYGSVIAHNDHNDDILSVSAGNDLDPCDLAHHEDMAIKPPNLATKPPDLTIQSPEMTIGSPATVAPTEFDVLEADSQSLQAANELNDVCMYDPDNTAVSWAPSGGFASFLEKHFRRKLSFDQVCEILEHQSVPSVEALVAPTLDQNVMQHIAPQNKKFVQERDKELQSVQRAFLNTTGPLCTLHDRLESNSSVDPASLKTIVEQTLCLLGSANTQLSILRRKKVLASINKGKIDLANHPLPNAKKWLFGDDFPSIASKEAELSRGLAKNLAPASSKARPQTSRSSNQSFSGNYQSKYQNSQFFRQRQKFFRPPRGTYRAPPNFQNTSNNGKN